MKKKTLVRDQDKFMLRLPDGMRDRIKAKAERAGMSMNEAIVWCLEREFPPEVTLGDRLEELAALISMLKDSTDPHPGVERLIAEMEMTLEALGKRGGIPVDKKFGQMVHDRLTYWHEMQLDDWRDRNESPFDDNNWPSPPDEDPSSDPHSADAGAD